MKQILAVLVILAIFLSGTKSSPIPSQALHSGQQSDVAHGQQQVPYMIVRGPIPKSRSEKAVWSHEREQRFLYINVKIRPSLVRLRRSY